MNPIEESVESKLMWEGIKKYLHKLTQNTQFIVITHRKPTMRHADTIFGVTMEEKGVTKIVSIEFEEAAKHAK